MPEGEIALTTMPIHVEVVIERKLAPSLGASIFPHWTTVTMTGTPGSFSSRQDTMGKQINRAEPDASTGSADA